MDMQNINLLIAIMIIFLGLVFVGISIGASIIIKHKQRTCTRPVVAQVVNMKRKRLDSFSSSSGSWYPVYEYFVDNQKMQKCSHIGGSKKAFKIGQNIDILINPQNSNEFYNPADQTSLLKTIFFIVGILLLFCGIGVLIINICV